METHWSVSGSVWQPHSLSKKAALAKAAAKSAPLPFHGHLRLPRRLLECTLLVHGCAVLCIWHCQQARCENKTLCCLDRRSLRIVNTSIG
jgi:hypothetical protein